MSVEAMTVVLHHSRATATAKVVLLGIANHDGDGGAWPSLKTLAKYANVAERNVRVALRQLEALGEIRCIHGAGGTHRTRNSERPNLYQVLVRCPADCDGGPQHRPRTPAVREDEIIPPPPVEFIPRGRTESSPEPSLEPSMEPSSGSTSSSDGPRGRADVRRRTTRRPLSKQQEAEEWRLLQELVRLEDMPDDPRDVWFTLLREHGAKRPGSWMQARVEAGEWDGFLASHGITEHTYS